MNYFFVKNAVFYYYMFKIKSDMEIFIFFTLYQVCF